MRIKNWIACTTKMSRIEKKLEREHTANFCFCPSFVSHNLGRKTRRKEKCLHIVTRIPLTMSGENTDEYPYYPYLFELHININTTN